MMFFSVLLAFGLDRILGEPKQHHPLVMYGRYVTAIETRLNRAQKSTRFDGVLAWLLAVVPVVFVAVVLSRLTQSNGLLHVLVSAGVLYVAIGWQSLAEHARAIIQPLQAGDLAQAQQALSMIVSRDTDGLDERAIAKGAAESVLENGADSIFSAVFWFLILGMPGVVLYRCSNTLDAMWGYKTERFLRFGWCAARMDDVLNIIPARLTALSYALMGNFSLAIQCWRAQGFNWKSPNAGPVMAAGAGAINVSLGGQAQYHGVLQSRPVLGPQESTVTQADSHAIEHACALVNRSVVLWLAAIAWVSYL